MRCYFWSNIHSQQMDLRPAASTLALTTFSWLLPYTKAWLTAHQGLEELQTTHHLWPSVHKDVNNDEESRCFDNQRKDSEEGTTWTSTTDRQRSNSSSIPVSEAAKIHFSQAIKRGWVWDLSHVNAVHRKVSTWKHMLRLIRKAHKNLHVSNLYWQKASSVRLQDWHLKKGRDVVFLNVTNANWLREIKCD